MAEINYIWMDKKRNVFGLPWTFTTYKLTKDKLLIETGLFSKKEEEIRLYRIMDLTLKRSLWQRILQMGTIHCCTSDKSAPEINLERIMDAQSVKELLSDMVEAAREEKRVVGRELIMDGGDCE